MPQRILVISSSATLDEEILAYLHEKGYPATSTKTLSKPSAEEQRPALCIVDLALSREVGQSAWEAWRHDCQTTHTACLAFDSTRQADHTLIASLEPLCGTFALPINKDHLMSKVHSLLTIRKLSRQLEATRHQMSHYQEELHDALESAANIQRSLIPKTRPAYHNLQFAWRYMPCKQVGGDLFNIVQLDEQTVMAYLVDVSGHGISSAMVTVSVHQSLSLHTGQLVKKPIEQPPYYEIVPPEQVMKELEAEYPFERFEEFFTISYLLINPHSGKLSYCNAGHPPPFLLRKNGSIELLDAGGTIIGVGELIEFEGGESRLEPGDRIFMYTDGITEHIGSDGEPYGEQRFLQQLIGGRGQSLDDVTRDALIAMREFGGSILPIDDVTLIGIEFN
jgi:sigma-B regulation protein RsbU (phosphoserine phosphatase)